MEYIMCYNIDNNNTIPYFVKINFTLSQDLLSDKQYFAPSAIEIVSML